MRIEIQRRSIGVSTLFSRRQASAMSTYIAAQQHSMGKLEILIVRRDNLSKKHIAPLSYNHRHQEVYITNALKGKYSATKSTLHCLKGIL